MKTLRRIDSSRVVLRGLVASWLLATAALAQDNRYWDIDGATPGAGGPTPSGTWNSTTGTNWSPNEAGDVETAAWVSGAAAGEGNVAVFSAGSDATGSFTVTVEGTNNAAGMIVKTGTVNIAGGGVVALGGGTATVMAGATLGINNRDRFTQTAGGLLILDGGTLLMSNAGNAGSLWQTTGSGIMVTANGGTISYSANAVTIYQGNLLGEEGTPINGGAQTLTKTGTSELRVQNANTANYSFQKLLVKQGLYRLGSTNAGQGQLTQETAFGAVPIFPLPDAITLDGGAIGSSFSIATDPFRGITLGPSGGLLNGAAGVLTVNGPIAGGGVLRIVGTNGTILTSLDSTRTGGTVIGSEFAMVGSITGSTAGALTISSDAALGAVPATPEPANIRLGTATAAGTLTISSNDLTISAHRGIQVGAGGGTLSTSKLVTYGGVLSGTGFFTKTSTGTLALSGNNTLTGGITSFGGGAVEISADANLGGVPVTTASNAITLAGATTSGRLRVTESFTMAPTRGITLNVGGTTATPLGGTIDVVADKMLTVAGPISGAGRLTKSGSGTLVLAGTSTYVGTTTVSAGTLVVNGLLSGTAAVTLSGGATLAGSGTVNGAARIAAFSTLSPGASPGTLAFGGNLTLAAGGDYNWQMLSATGTAGATNAWDLVTVSGTLDITATSADPFAINLWSLSSISPDTSGSAANFDPAQNYNWTIARATGGITGFAADTVMVTTSATNGTGGFANDLAGGTFSLAQSGNNLNLVFTASGGAPSVITINVASGTQTQAAAGYPLLSGATSVVKTGAGTLVVDQANTLTGSTTVQEGVLQLANGSALASSTLAVAAGGTAQVANFLTTSVAALDLAGNGLIDVTSGFMTVAGGLSETALVAEILEGRGTGTWTGTSGITSSVAAADVALGIPRTVGWLDNGNGSVSFAFAAPGDTNLDWQVDVLDAANVIAGGKFNTEAAATWAQGDFNYDGLFNVLDAADFITTGLYNQGSYNQPPGAVGAVAAVPEPTLGLAGIAMLTAAAALFARRR